jgi:hypothetical protein
VRWTSAGGTTVLAPATTPPAVLPPLPGYAPISIAVDGQNTVYVLVGGQLKKVQNGALVTVATVGPTPAAGASAGNVISTDASGNVYVADRELIRRVTPSGTVTVVAGQSGVTSIQAGALPGGVGDTRALVVDPMGVLHVATTTAALGGGRDTILARVRLAG